MLKRIIFLLKYYFGIIIYFAYFRALFFIYQQQLLHEVSTTDLIKSFFYALPLDISFASYLISVPIILIALSSFFAPHVVRPIFKLYSVIIITLLSILHIVDLELFRNWGFRIDNSFLKYLNTPTEMWASSASSPLFILLILLGVSIIGANYLFNRIIDSSFQDFNSITPKWIILFASIFITLIIPIRGGFQQIPINQSVAYFSARSIINQATINAPWNFLQSFFESTSTNRNPFFTMDTEKAVQTVSPLYIPNKQVTSSVNEKAPNVILIVWESFTSKVVSSLGGEQNVTLKFDSLIHHGTLIDGMYASASRSDKGLVAILSGYPSQGSQSIMKLPSKTLALPSLANEFQLRGYSTNFYYGGELEFANMKSYLMNTGYQGIIGKESFEEKDMNSKWGAHDGVLFNRVLSDLKKRDALEPYFTTIFTLSSHEPFEVPVKTVIPGDDEASLFSNSMHYTDQAIGNFLEELKQLPDYDNTIVIITADHGHRMPNNTAIEAPETYKVPFLWLGPQLVKADTIIHKISSQTDIASTLLNRLGMNDSAFHWSKDLLNVHTKSFALATMKTGFIWIDTLGAVSYDYQGKQLIYDTHPQADSVSKLGKAHLQLTFQDFLNK